MATSDSGREYLNFELRVPGGIPGGPAKKTVFSIIAADMLLRDAPSFVEELRGVVDEANLSKLIQGVGNLMADPAHGPRQQHVIVFSSTPPTDDPVVLRDGALAVFKVLEAKWKGKTISVIHVPWELFEKLQQVTTQFGFWPTPPPSIN